MSESPSTELADVEGQIRNRRYAISRWHVVLLASLLVISAALRFYHIGSTPVWCDELLSIHLSDGHNFAVDRLPRNELIVDPPNLMSLDNARPAWTVWSSLSGDVHPPLYYVALRVWRECFGDSPLGIRSLSAVLGTLAVAAMFLAGRELMGTVAGLWVALLNTFASQHIYYSQEARMYSMALLLSGLVMWLVLRIERLGFNAGRGVALALTSLMAMLTLYLSAAVLLPCAAYLLFRLRGRTRVATLLAFVIAGLAFAAVWLPFFQPIDQAKADWLKAARIDYGTFARSLLLIPMGHFGVLRESMTPSAFVFAMAVILLPLAAMRRAPQILLPWLCTMTVLFLPAIADLVRSTNMLRWERYTLLLIPSISLAIVATSHALLHRQRFVVRYGLPAALGVFSLLSLAPLYTDVSRYDFRANALLAEKASINSDRRLIFATTWNSKFNSVLLLSAQYYWAQPPREIVLVESVDEIERLPRDVVSDHLVLVAGDLPADLSKLTKFEPAGPTTWQLGVGSVHTLRRTDAPKSVVERQ